MSSRKHLGSAIACMVLVVSAGGMLLAWPVYREAARLNGQAAALRAKGENYEAQAQRIVNLTAQLEAATRRVDTEFKVVPATPDVAGLMRVLSLPVDGKTVLDQQFMAGEEREAVPGAQLDTLVAPLTIEMEARFDAVFALLRAAESMERLLRIASINLTAERDEDPDRPFARATIVLEAVYEPHEEGP